MLLDFAYRVYNLVHIVLRSEQHRLSKPDSILAELVVRRALDPIVIGAQLGFRKALPVMPRSGDILDDWFLV
jgi:hypothetical protein